MAGKCHIQLERPVLQVASVLFSAGGLILDQNVVLCFVVVLTLNIKDFIRELDSKATAYNTWDHSTVCTANIVLLRFSHGFSRVKCEPI